MPRRGEFNVSVWGWGGPIDPIRFETDRLARLPALDDEPSGSSSVRSIPAYGFNAFHAASESNVILQRVTLLYSMWRMEQK
jgi:hypothetical protein